MIGDSIKEKRKNCKSQFFLFFCFQQYGCRSDGEQGAIANDAALAVAQDRVVDKVPVFDGPSRSIYLRSPFLSRLTLMQQCVMSIEGSSVWMGQSRVTPLV